MATTSDIKNGLCIEYNHGLYVVTDFQHVKPGKGPAFVRTKLKNIETGKVIDNTFSSGHKITTARIERRDSNNYEQMSLEENLITGAQFLKDGQDVEIVYHAELEKPLTCELPAFVVLKITYTEPGIKGDTATNSTKAATLETGAVIQVPLFINQDEIIKVDTRTGSYSERVK